MGGRRLGGGGGIACVCVSGWGVGGWEGCMGVCVILMIWEGGIMERERK